MLNRNSTGIRIKMMPVLFLFKSLIIKVNFPPTLFAALCHDLYPAGHLRPSILLVAY